MDKKKLKEAIEKFTYPGFVEHIENARGSCWKFNGDKECLIVDDKRAHMMMQALQESSNKR